MPVFPLPIPASPTCLLEQFGGGNGELKAAMQYFVQAFGCRQPYPDKYDLLMDIATEEFSHLEIVVRRSRCCLKVSTEIQRCGRGQLGRSDGSVRIKKKDVIGMAMDNPALSCNPEAARWSPTAAACRGPGRSSMLMVI